MAPPFPPRQSFPARSRGWCAATACRLEARAPKPGNVHPRAAFPDLAFNELVAAGEAIAPVLHGAVGRPLGDTILDAVRASRRVTRSNANLGIVLALAPLAATPGDPGPIDPAQVATTLAGLSGHDAAAVWEAIRIAAPSGLGTRARHDLAGAAPADLMAAMRDGAAHDRIARLWVEGYQPIREGLAADILAGCDEGHALDDAVVRAFLRQLSREPDSLVVRRHGVAVASAVAAGAATALAAVDWREAAARFDARLRYPRRINPGTTADLVAAALYILLWEGRLRGDVPDG